MTTQYNTDRRSAGPFFAFLFALLLGAAALALFLRHATTGYMARIADRIAGRTTTFDTSVPAVVQRIQRLSRLETVVYSMDTIVEGSKSSQVLPDLLAGDRILLVVHGQAIAGIDLAALAIVQPIHPSHPAANPSVQTKLKLGRPTDSTIPPFATHLLHTSFRRRLLTSPGLSSLLSSSPRQTLGLSSASPTYSVFFDLSILALALAPALALAHSYIGRAAAQIALIPPM